MVTVTQLLSGQSFTCRASLAVMCAAISLWASPVRSANIPETCSRYGTFTRLSEKQIATHLIRRVEPKNPLIENGVVDAIIPVHVLVDEYGSVVCALVAADINPLLGRIS